MRAEGRPYSTFSCFHAMAAARAWYNSPVYQDARSIGLTAPPGWY
ncbi:DUF1330 domain-containing protein [Pseudomonas sp. MIL9]|nr:DUF1330 domain-containing protein [Pseudomonas sp. MIL9]